MIELIKKVLATYPQVEWTINEESVSSYELFFVRRLLQMNRAKDVKHYKLSVYVEQAGFKGTADFAIHPGAKEEEVKRLIEEGVYAASLAKNKTFVLPGPKKLKLKSRVSNMDEQELSVLALRIAEAVFKNDTEEKGFLNATEVFVNRKSLRVYNSNGIDYSKTSTEGQVEYITTYRGSKEEIELYRFLEFTDFSAARIAADVKEQFRIAKYRAEAKEMKNFTNINVVFNAADIRELMNYYYCMRSNVRNIYNHSSDWQVGVAVQDLDAKGDKLNLSLNPDQKGSTGNCPFDRLGSSNEKVAIIKDGKVAALWGSSIYGQYLGYETKVNTNNVELGLGSLSDEDLEKESYLELLSLSGLQVDDVTGSFGSEIRLALYHEKGKVTPYYGSSINGFLKEVSSSWQFSQQKVQINHYHGPKKLLIKGVNIFGK